MEFGISTSIVRMMTPVDSICKLSELGFKYLELSYENFIATKTHLTDDVIRDILTTSSSQEELRIVQVHAPYEVSNFVVGDRKEILRNVEKLIPWIRLSSELNAVLIIHPATLTTRVEESTHEYSRKLELVNIEFFKLLGAMANDYGVRIAIENRADKAFGCSAQDLLLLIESIGLEGVGTCIDVGHVVINKYDIRQYIRHLARTIKAVHLHDTHGYSDDHLPPLMGCIDWSSVVKSLREIGYSRPIIFEPICNLRTDICINWALLTKVVAKYFTSSTH